MALSAGFVEISDLSSPTESEKSELIRRCRDANLALYQTVPGADTRAALRQFARAFDLRIAERHRQQVEAIAPTAVQVQRLLAAARDEGIVRPGEALAVDVDPVGMM